MGKFRISSVRAYRGMSFADRKAERVEYRRREAVMGNIRKLFKANCGPGAAYLSSEWVDRERGLPLLQQRPRRFVFLCGVEYASPVARMLEAQASRELMLGRRSTRPAMCWTTTRLHVPRW